MCNFYRFSLLGLFILYYINDFSYVSNTQDKERKLENKWLNFFLARLDRIINQLIRTEKIVLFSINSGDSVILLV